jgi:nicotinamidase-related amidase
MGNYTNPDWANSALLTIDTQRDFTLPGAPDEIPGTMEAASVMRRLVAAFRQEGKPIVHVVRLYRPDGSNADLCRREAIEQGKSVTVLSGSDGSGLVDELKPSSEVSLDAELLLGGDLQEIGEKEWIMYKPRWGAFYQTPLQAHLQELGINTVVICGCNFPNCPRTTIYEASERDYRVVLVTDAISGLYERGSQELKRIGVELMDAEACLEQLGSKALR